MRVERWRLQEHCFVFQLCFDGAEALQCSTFKRKIFNHVNERKMKKIFFFFSNRLQTWCLVSVTFDKRWMIVQCAYQLKRRKKIFNVHSEFIWMKRKKKRNRKLGADKLCSSLIKLIQLESRLFWNKVFIPSSESHFDEYEKWMTNKVYEMQIHWLNNVNDKNDIMLVENGDHPLFFCVFCFCFFFSAVEDFWVRIDVYGVLPTNRLISIWFVAHLRRQSKKLVTNLLNTCEHVIVFADKILSIFPFPSKSHPFLSRQA